MINRNYEQHGALVALAMLNVIDNLSTIATLGRYSLALEDKVLLEGHTDPDDATFFTIIRDAVTSNN